GNMGSDPSLREFAEYRNPATRGLTPCCLILPGCPARQESTDAAGNCADGGAFFLTNNCADGSSNACARRNHQRFTLPGSALTAAPDQNIRFHFLFTSGREISPMG